MKFDVEVRDQGMPNLDIHAQDFVGWMVCLLECCNRMMITFNVA